MSDKFQNKYRIPSARADWWDYGWNAAYFVTICTAHRECYFGEIISNVMQLSEIGRLADKFWRSIPEHFSFVKLDAFVVMPNHIHGILIIDKPNDNRNMNGIGPHVETGQCPVCDDIRDDRNVNHETGQIVETRQCLVSTNDDDGGTSNDDEPKTPGELRFRNQGKHTLSSIIGSFKSVVSKHAHPVHAEFEWQERFHDHIIRDEEEYHRIVTYIENNVANWPNDKFYTP